MKYFDLIFTLHAQDQLKERGIKIEDAWETFKHPTSSEKNDKGKGLKISKEFEDYKITVIATQGRNNEWVIVSCWRNPPLPGTEDAKRKILWKKYNKSGILGQLIMQIRQQLGI